MEGEISVEALRLVSTLHMPKDEWLEWRRNGIGGSDVGAICDVNPYSSPVEVYLEKIGELKEQPDNESMYWGRALEHIIALEFKTRTGLRIQRVNAMLQHPENPWAIGDIDRLIIDKENGKGVLEVKNASEYTKTQWESGQIPESYFLQLQWYMFVTGLNYGYLAALVGGNKFYCHRVERDEDIIRSIVKICGDFWHENVLKRIPPAFDGSDASAQLLKALYPESTPKTKMHLPQEAGELIAQYEQAVSDEKDAKSRKEEAANRLKAMLGENETGVFGGRKVVWKTFKQSRLDQNRLKSEQPELYEAFQKEIVIRKFEIKGA